MLEKTIVYGFGFSFSYTRAPARVPQKIKMFLKQASYPSSLCKDIETCYPVCSSSGCPHATANFSVRTAAWEGKNMWQRSSGRDLETDSRLSLMCRKIVEALEHGVA